MNEHRFCAVLCLSNGQIFATSETAEEKEKKFLGENALKLLRKKKTVDYMREKTFARLT